MHEQMNNIKKKTKTIKIEKSTPYSKPYASIKKPENWFEWVFLGSSSINGSTNQLPKNPQNIYVIYLQMWECKIKQTYLMNIWVCEKMHFTYHYIYRKQEDFNKALSKDRYMCVCGTFGNIRTPNFGIAISLVLNVCVL